MTTPYAPTYASSYESGRNLDDEVRLYTKVAERETYESLAELFSIVVSLELLEKGYIKDTIPHARYTPACLRLLAQYKTLLKNPAVDAAFGDLDAFRAAYRISYPAATERLRIGVPATVEQPGHHASPEHQEGHQSGHGGQTGISARAAAEATQTFITFMDALRLNYKAKDQLHPLLSEVMTTLNRATTADFDGRGKIVQWLITLNQMRATDEVSQEQSREMLFDLEHAYNVYLSLL